MKSRGFTLLEILIALFIFTILSMILVSALQTVINAVSGTENSAARFRHLQMALVIMSRDIEQTINRPILDAAGKEEPAFKGTRHGFTFTHLGIANPTGNFTQSSMQRSRYDWVDKQLLRQSWEALDRAPKTKLNTRILLNNVEEVRIEYIDSKGHVHNDWPAEGEGAESVPRAVRIFLSFAHWGDISQLYVISAQANKK